MTELLAIAQELFHSIPAEDRNALVGLLNSVKRVPEVTQDIETTQAKISALTAALERHIVESDLATDDLTGRLERLEKAILAEV